MKCSSSEEHSSRHILQGEIRHIPLRIYNSVKEHMFREA